MSVVTVLATALSAVLLQPALRAEADTSPPAGTPATVSADGLPTWQLNGVVWSQAVVGNTVYATGSFTKARPPGVAAGGAGEIAANNIFAYDIRTGARVTSFNHSLDGQGLAVKASPNGTRVFVAGDFTSVDGVAKNHVAAFDAATGNLVTGFAASVSGRADALAVSNDTLFVGGNFFSANGQARRRLASFSTTTGAVKSWAPTADDEQVTSMVLAPAGDRVIIGGKFSTLNGAPAPAMGAVDAVTGASRPWAINQVMNNAGKGSSISSLSTDGTNIYGTGYAFESGNFEGGFAARPDTGAVVWLNDCHGDTYDGFPQGGVFYTVSHAHDCKWIGAFPQTDANWHINMRHALAYSTDARGTNTGPDNYGWNYNGQPASALLQWFPVVAVGTFTGQSQAAWSVTGNSDYTVLGGEFPSVNNVAQQGLVRFATRAIAPNKRGPARAPAAPAPTATSFAKGSVRVGWQSAYDMDNESLTYDVYRSGTAAPVYSTTTKTNYWTYPGMGFIDNGLTSGASYTYTIKVTDPTGNVLTLPKTPAVIVSDKTLSQYSKDVLADGATNYWRLGEPSGTSVLDYAGFNDATAQTGVTRGAGGAFDNDTDGSSTFNGSSDGFVVQNSSQDATSSFTAEAWVKTTSTSGGKIIGYGASATGNSGSYDRHVYMDNSGHIIFGVYPGSVRAVGSAKTFNDGSWHHVVASLSDTAGMALYVDGKKVGADAGTTSAQQYPGYWRIGGDNLGGWPNQPSSNYLAGNIDDVAIYPSALSLAKVQAHYVDSGRTLGGTPKPTDAYGAAVYDSGPDLFWRLTETSGSAAKDASPNGADGVYAGGVTKGQPGLVTGGGSAAGFDGSSGTVASANKYSNPTVYSEELWFKTSSTRGGKLVGFGDQQSGLSGNYDRHVYMENSGQLTFGVWTGQANTITSTRSYNDGQAHHLVATQSGAGMKLYVDGDLVGTNPQTQAQGYEGYWRIGGDTSWGGDSNWFNGTIDEAAIYSSALSAAEVRAHFVTGGGSVPNQAPQAAFTSSVDQRNVTLDGAGSTDPHGSISSYRWEFGDTTSETTTGSGTSHAYTSPGTYTVKLTVTDDKGATASVSHDVTVANIAPQASFGVTTDQKRVDVDGSQSSDADGTVASYDWNWGDGSTHGSGVTATHTYAQTGGYTVTLTVTDNDGAQSVVTHDVTATQNQAPDAAFTSTVNEKSVAVDGSGSADADGSVASYSWNWGDSTSNGAGVNATHTYATNGTYTITLTVTDNAGSTGQVAHDVTVAAAATPQLIGSDDFGRTVTAGWGSADTGGIWSLVGTKANFKVAGGSGTISMPTAGSGPSANLTAVTSKNSDVQLSFSPAQVPTGSGTFVSVIGRQVAGVGTYRAVANLRSNGTVSLTLVRVDGAGQATIVPATIVSGLTYAAGDKLSIRMQVTDTSPTVVRAKVWKSSLAEPTSWLLTGSDGASAMQASGYVGLMSYLAANATAGTAVSFDDLRVFDTTGIVQAPQVQALAARQASPHTSDDPPVATQVSP